MSAPNVDSLTIDAKTGFNTIVSRSHHRSRDVLRGLALFAVLAAPFLLKPSEIFAGPGVDPEVHRLIELAATRISSAQAAEATSYITAHDLYRSALAALTDATTRFPHDPAVADLVLDKYPVAGITLSSLRESILPAIRRRADAEANPLQAIAYTAASQANPWGRGTALDSTLQWLIQARRFKVAIDFVLSTFERSERVSGLLLVAEQSRGEDKPLALEVGKAALEYTTDIRDPRTRAPAFTKLARHYGAIGLRVEGVDLLQQAEASAERILNIGDRAVTIADIAAAYARLGDSERADALFAKATELLLSSPESGTGFSWGRLALAFGDARRYTDAVEVLSKTHHDSYQHAVHLLHLADLATEQGDSAIASGLLATIDSSTQSLGRHQQARKTVQDFTVLAATAAQYGNARMATDLLREAEDIATSFPRSDEQAWLLDQIVERYLAMRDIESAVRILARCLELLKPAVPGSERPREGSVVFNPEQSIVIHLAQAGQPKQALGALRLIDHEGSRLRPMTAIAKAFYADGPRSDALAVLAEATTIVKKQQEPARSFDTVAVAEAYAAVGEPELAMQLLSEPLQRPDPLSYWSILSALGAIAKSFHAMGDVVGTQETLAVALNLARSAPQGSPGLSFWPSLVRYHVAVDLEEQATDIARGISDERVRHDALTAIIQELRSAGKTELARDREVRFLHDGLLPPPDAHATERLQSDSITTSEEAEQRIDSLPTLRQRADAYARLAQRFAAAGQVATASRLLDRAIAVARSLPDDGGKVSTLIAAAAVWDNFGDSRRARRFLAEARIALDAASKDLDTPGDTASSLGLSLARSYAKAGYYDLAIRTARGIRSLAPRIHAFVEIAQALHRKGNPGRAVTVIDEVLPLISRVARNSPTRLAAAEALADLGEGALAWDVIQATVLDEPRIPGARMWAARIYLKLRRYPDAIQLLDHALSSESHSAERYRANVRDLVLIALTIAETPPNSPEQTHAILHRVIRLADLPTGNRN